MYMNAVDTKMAVARGEIKQRGSRKLAAAAWSTSGEVSPRLLENEPGRGFGKPRDCGRQTQATAHREVLNSSRTLGARRSVKARGEGGGGVRVRKTSGSHWEEPLNSMIGVRLSQQQFARAGTRSYESGSNGMWSVLRVRDLGWAEWGVRKRELGPRSKGTVRVSAGRR